jgi:hypothetical protein
VLGGALMPADGARWVWLAGAITIAVSGVVGFALARESVRSAQTAELPAS